MLPDVMPVWWYAKFRAARVLVHVYVVQGIRTTQPADEHDNFKLARSLAHVESYTIIHKLFERKYKLLSIIVI